MALDVEQLRKDFALDNEATKTIRSLIKKGVMIATRTEDNYTTTLYYRKVLDMFVTKKGMVVFHLDPKGECVQRKKK